MSDNLDETGEFELTVTDAIRKYARGKMTHTRPPRKERRQDDKLSFKDWIGLVSVFVLPLAGSWYTNHIAVIRLQDSHNVLMAKHVEEVKELKAWNRSISARVRDLEKGD